MEKTEFIEKIKAEVAEFGKIIVKDMHRANTTYTGLAVDVTGVPTPVVNMDMLYTKYCEDEFTFGECVRYAKKTLNMKMELDFDPKDITKWDMVKDRLYLRLVGNANKGLYRKVADMYLIPYIRIVNDDSAAARVIPEMLTAWGVDEDTVFEQAKTNQEIIRPATITNIATKIGLPDILPLYVVSTNTEVNGASAILYEGVADKVKDMIGDFYILPSSIHEVIVVPKSYRNDIEALSEMVRTVNNSEVSEDDRLTNSVYDYDFENGEIRKVG